MGKGLYRFARFLTPALKWIYPLKTFGPRKFESKNTVFVSNHTSGWDPVIWTVWCKSRIHFMYKAEFRKSKFLRSAFDHLELIPVTRGDVDLGAIKYSLELLSRGEIVGIFPEGTRNKVRDTLKDFRTGAAMLAIKSKSPVRPFYVWDKYKPFHMNYLLVGEEFTLEQFYDQPLTKQVLKEATAIIQSKVDELRIRLDKMMEEKGKKRRKLSKKEKLAAEAQIRQQAQQALLRSGTQSSDEKSVTIEHADKPICQLSIENDNSVTVISHSSVESDSAVNCDDANKGK